MREHGQNSKVIDVFKKTPHHQFLVNIITSSVGGSCL